jgi:WhiB family redox-sensing transcriptional regulator
MNQPDGYNHWLRYFGTDPKFAADTDDSWRDDAACKGLHPNLFFVGKGARADEAKELCRGCPVRVACAEFAIRTSQQFGVWGGYSARELTHQRARVRRELGLAA